MQNSRKSRKKEGCLLTKIRKPRRQPHPYFLDFLNPLNSLDSGYFDSGVIPPAALAASFCAFIFLVSSAFWTHTSALSTSALYCSDVSSRSAFSRISRFI